MWLDGHDKLLSVHGVVCSQTTGEQERGGRESVNFSHCPGACGGTTLLGLRKFREADQIYNVFRPGGRFY